MADRKISDLTALTTPATGDLIPIVDISEAAAADKNKSITVGELLRGAPDGTAAAPGFAFESDGGNGMFLDGTDTLAFSTGGTQAVTIDASQRLGLGTSTPDALLQVGALDASGTSRGGIAVKTAASAGTFGESAIYIEESSGAEGFYIGVNSDGALFFSNSGTTTPLFIGDDDRVGIGTTSVADILDVKTSSSRHFVVRSGGSPEIYSQNDSGNVEDLIIGGNNLNFFTGTGASGTQSMRIDENGRLLVGTTSSSSLSKLVVKGRTSGTNQPGSVLLKSDNTPPGADRGLAEITFADTNEYVGASISSAAEGAFTGSSSPGRLVFSTTADGASSPTERMRIDSQGFVGIGGVSPTRKLHVHESAAGTNSYVSITNDATGSTDSDGFQLICLSGGEAVLMQRESASMLFYTDGTQKAEITSAGRFYLSSTWYSTFTTANAANVHAVSNGEFYRSTSSLKYKTDVETIQDSYSDAILNIRPVWYRSLADADNSDHSWWGFIAEEVAEVDPRLVQWKTVDVTYDEEGSAVETPCDPEPEGVAYDRFVPHLLNLIKRQKEQIEAMEARLSALEAQ